MASPLTERQNEALEFVRAYVREHRKPPTFVEIGAALSIRSTNAVSKLVRALVDKGHLRHTPNVARGLALADDESAGGDPGAAPILPVLGRVTSDVPSRLRLRPSGYLTVDPVLLARADPDACLVARVGDDGMNSDGIRKGDLVVAHEGSERRSGDLVLAIVGDQAIVRRYEYLNGRIHLHPADRRYTVDVSSPGEPRVYVVGRVLTVVRRIA